MITETIYLVQNLDFRPVMAISNCINDKMSVSTNGSAESESTDQSETEINYSSF